VRLPAETPGRLRLLAAGVGVLAAVWALVLVVETRQARTGVTVLSQSRAPVVRAASDLYFALNDMDAQLANVLLVGDDTGLGVTRSQALDIFERRRVQGDADVQEVAAAVSDPAGARDIRGLLDGLGRYEALAAEVLLRPRADAVTAYRSATDLLRLTLLPLARDLADGQARTLEAGYAAERSRARATLAATAVLGGLLLVLLLVTQLYLTRRFRRLVNPALAAASLLVLGMLAASVLVEGVHLQRLRTAKSDAFDSLLVLEQARAVSYDANADESRYLLDPQRSEQYERAFQAKTQQLVDVGADSLAVFDQRLDAAVAAYRRDRSRVGWNGYLGSEFRNITFPGERAAAELALDRYREYQADDRRIRQLAGSGQRRAAVALCTSYAPGGSNYAFDRFDTALTSVITINEDVFRTASRADRDTLTAWWLVPAGGALVVLVLLVLGVRPRLGEYR